MAKATDSATTSAEQREKPPTLSLATLAESAEAEIEDAGFRLYALCHLANDLHIELDHLTHLSIHDQAPKMYRNGEAVLHLARKLLDDLEMAGGQLAELGTRLYAEAVR